MNEKNQDIVYREISTVLYVFDENCLLPKDSLKSEKLEKIFLNEIEENFVNYKRLDHRIYPRPQRDEYLQDLTKFKYTKNGDWIEYSGTNKDLALVKLFTSGLYDQDEDFLFCMNHPKIREKPLKPTCQMAKENLLGPFAPIITINNQFPQCLVIFITGDKAKGMNNACFSIQIDRISKINFAKMKVNINNKTPEERVIIAGKEIGKSMTNVEVKFEGNPPYHDINFITPEGIIDGRNPPWATFGFNNKIIEQ